MSWFKRLCMFVFGLSGLAALAALALTWVGPWTTQTRAYLELPWYFATLEVLVCIAGVGLLACLLVSLFSPRNPKETIVATVEGGQITVTRAAISSQAMHVIEADGTCVASSVRVRVRKRGHVRVNARVTPRRPVDVVQRGARLYEELEEGLARICGDSVQSIDIVFTEPEHPEISAPRVAVSDDEPVAAAAGESITVPVSTLASAQGDEPMAEAEPSSGQPVEAGPASESEPEQGFIAEPESASEDEPETAYVQADTDAPEQAEEV